jgi:heme exporter protein A
LDLACFRGERAIFAGLSFGLAAGDALLLVGANGAGKSTLLRLLAGLLAPAEGQLLWDGVDALADRAAHAGRLRYLSHQDALKPALTVRENLAFFARLWGSKAGGGKVEGSKVGGGDTDAALAALDLAPLAELPARVLSSGQKRRLALARLALAPAALWLLDEPTVGLDAASVERLGSLLARHRAAGGMVLAATHLPLPLPGARELRL